MTLNTGRLNFILQVFSYYLLEEHVFEGNELLILFTLSHNCPNTVLVVGNYKYLK
jgi:hypothetical protein